MKVGDSVQFGEVTSILELPTKTVYEVESKGRKCWYNIEALADRMEETVLRKDLVKG